jgi:hypothetical protein
VLVCVAIVENGLTGLTPMPNDSTVRAKLRLRIEQPTSPTKTASDFGQARRSGSPVIGDIWTSWCT